MKRLLELHECKYLLVSYFFPHSLFLSDKSRCILLYS